MSKTRFKIILTEKQLQVVQTALFEYAEICMDQGTDGMDKDEYWIAKVDKKSMSYQLSKAMQKVSDSIRTQMVRAKLKKGDL